MAIEAPSGLDELAGRVYTAVVSDALDAFSSDRHVLSPRIRPVGDLDGTLVGRAATARAVGVEELPQRPYAVLLESMDRLAAGHVWVVASDGDGAVRSAIFGGLLATAARARGAIGCIVDGAVRDTRELRRLRFPTFATGFSPADSKGRDEVVEHSCPVRCGDVDVYPGDMIVADHDGVVVVPQELEERVLERALAKAEGEGGMKKELAAGLPAADAFAKYGIL
jgi:4-hydroxy-4-methyl-2-oxoglutarate aldolase